MELFFLTKNSGIGIFLSFLNSVKEIVDRSIWYLVFGKIHNSGDSTNGTVEEAYCVLMRPHVLPVRILMLTRCSLYFKLDLHHNKDPDRRRGNTAGGRFYQSAVMAYSDSVSFAPTDTIFTEFSKR
jgi:hypothetical protein